MIQVWELLVADIRNEWGQFLASSMVVTREVLRFTLAVKLAYSNSRTLQPSFHLGKRLGKRFLEREIFAFCRQSQLASTLRLCKAFRCFCNPNQSMHRGKGTKRC